MKLKVFTVFDSKAELYLSPFYMRSRGEALRSFADTVKDSNSAFNKHPGDYTLFELGDYNESTGSFGLYDAKVNLGMAQDFLSSLPVPEASDDVNQFLKRKA